MQGYRILIPDKSGLSAKPASHHKPLMQGGKSPRREVAEMIPLTASGVLKLKKGIIP